MINVLAVFQDFGTSSVYYSYNNFGGFRIEEFVWHEIKSDIFPNRMQNLHGVTLPILLGGPQPGLIISKNAKVDTKIGGYVGNILSAFAKRHNARLSNLNVNTSVAPRDIYPQVEDGTVDILGAFPLRTAVPANFYSYPFTISDWCVMIPIEPKIPIYKVFAIVFHWEAFVLTIAVFIVLSVSRAVVEFFSGSHEVPSVRVFFFNIDCFRGILGQSISEDPKASCSTKIIYSLIFLLGIMMVTSYDAFLQSLMTETPTENMIRNFDDLETHNLKIYIYKTYFKYWSKLHPNFQQYSNSFEIEDSLETFDRLRDSFNPKYAYAVTKDKWKVLNSQQNFFDQRRFRWSDELCMFKNAPASFALNENTIYRNILNSHILDIQSAGLMDFWTEKAFYELIEIGKIKKLNFTNELNLRPLKVEDFKWIWIAMGLAYTVATLCFIGGLER
ncbi:uncharacterized protein LOC129918080 [Episyrphus balteatus]|uniref:uncharacterized protein LOC129918080 n=1 Tax=Episyrphus balteatus TaxID=286459 RepID=UPI002485633F|nr:uncharacterized protein LOC129918080 [Episyrphus balteatus]